MPSQKLRSRLQEAEKKDRSQQELVKSLKEHVLRVVEDRQKELDRANSENAQMKW